jgi:hypothetical protein
VRVTVPVEQAVLPQPARGVVGVDPDEGTSVSLESETQVTVKVNPDPLPDPSELGEAESECEPSSGEYPVSAPSNDPSPEPFDEITDESLVERPGFLSLKGETVLRWGQVELDMRQEFPRYPGWGYQHIKAKHGWSRVDESATREALLTSAFPNRRIRDAWDFIGPEYVQGRFVCVREVVVNPNREGEDPQERGVYTSYGRRLSPLPDFMHPSG